MPLARVDIVRLVALAALVVGASAGLSLPAVGDDRAEGPIWWSLAPIERPAVPRVDWPRSDIDRFIYRRMQESGLTPTGDADRQTLLRRASFDLIGMPPPEEVAAEFLADESPDAFEKLIDRLLQSPHFGERWGRHWLDLARYADSTGGGRSMLYGAAWRFRDYVVASLNADKPYDQFVREQIAGDLLPAESPEQAREQLVATAFLALGPTNYELQDKEQLRMDVVAEQIDTVGRAMMGMSLGCARCHDHMFDPISIRDYYALAGIFRSTKTLEHDNVSSWVKRPMPEDAETANRRRAYQKQVENAKSAAKASRERLASLEQELGILTLDDTQAKLTGEWASSSTVTPFVHAGYQYAAGSAKAVFQAKAPKPGRFRVLVGYTPHANRMPAVQVALRHAGGRHERVLDQRTTPDIGGQFVSLGEFDLEDEFSVTLKAEGNDGVLVADAVQIVPADEREGGDGDEAPDAVLAEHREAMLAAHDAMLRQQQLAESGPPKPPEVMAVTEETAIDDCPVHNRGDRHDPGEMAPRGFPDQIAGPHAAAIPAEVSGRAELADWITDPANPLTARVMANRVWRHLFGHGLVRTPDNFGLTGRPPTHPELLDHLASELVDNGWSVKQLIRQIMLSRAYQLSSHGSAATAQDDPENKWLTRQNRRRLDAESLHDAILSFSGRLDLSIGGDPVAPETKTETGYEFTYGRRAIYLPVFRNQLADPLAIFDFANPNHTVGHRPETTGAAQAMYLMNSPFVREQAEHAARRLLDEAPTGAEPRIRWAFQQALTRTPRPEELLTLRRHIEGAEGDELQSWTAVCHAVVACIDFRYVD